MVTGYRRWRPLGVVALLAGVAGCPSLEIVNKNAPERERAFSDPQTVAATAAGTIKSYINLRENYEPSLAPFSTMADEHSFSWNNFQSRYYSSYGVECPERCGWQNETTGARYEPLPIWWYGSYSLISAANDVLFAIRKSTSPPDLGADAGWAEVAAQMGQGLGYGLLALTYDQGFVVTEESAVDPVTGALDPGELRPRAELRDAAIAQLDHAATLAAQTDFSVAPATLFGVPSGPRYTSAQMVQIIRTFEAELLAMYPRTAAENAAVNWAAVVNYAKDGISSGTPFDFEAYQGNFTQSGYSDFFSGIEQWGNDYTTTRIDTRVARLLSTTQQDPWPGGAGNPRPADALGQPIGGVYGVDKRLGDGCFGTKANQFGEGECVATPNSGTDFMWSPAADFPASRGQFHQSNIGYIRYHCLVSGFPDCSSGAGNFVILSKYANDLLWAEGLLRTTGPSATVAQLINNSHVGRGGLPPVSGADTKENLLKALYYEWHAELVSMSPDHFWNARRLTTTNLIPAPPNPWATNQQTYEPEGPYVWNPLWGNSPRSMPIPAKDLNLLRLEIYTFGGPDDPTGCGAAGGPSCSPGVEGAPGVRSVRQIYAALKAALPKPGTKLRQ